jgi:type I restriction enzyme S subunit
MLAADEPFSFTDGPFGSNLKTADYVSKGIRVIRLQNVGQVVGPLFTPIVRR